MNTNSIVLASRFAAYSWYLNQHEEATIQQANDFAAKHWKQFVSLANQGFGKLLQRIVVSKQSVHQKLAI